MVPPEEALAEVEADQAVIEVAEGEEEGVVEAGHRDNNPRDASR